MSQIKRVTTIYAGVCAALNAMSFGAASAQGGQSEDTKLLISSAMYEVDGESGLFGLVVSVAEKKALFKPCYGPAFEIEQERLRSTKFTCEDAPSPDPNPLIVSCREGDAQWDEVAAVAAAQVQRMGNVSSTVSVASDGTILLEDVPKETVAKIMNAVSQFKNCGQWTVGFSIEGEPIMHVLHADVALDPDIRRQ